MLIILLGGNSGLTNYSSHGQLSSTLIQGTDVQLDLIKQSIASNHNILLLKHIFFPFFVPFALYSLLSIFLFPQIHPLLSSSLLLPIPLRNPVEYM